jgi:hypothetical protein
MLWPLPRSAFPRREEFKFVVPSALAKQWQHPAPLQTKPDIDLVLNSKQFSFWWQGKNESYHGKVDLESALCHAILVRK